MTAAFECGGGRREPIHDTGHLGRGDDAERVRTESSTRGAWLPPYGSENANRSPMAGETHAPARPRVSWPSIRALTDHRV